MNNLLKKIYLFLPKLGFVLIASTRHLNPLSPNLQPARLRCFKELDSSIA